MKKTYKVIVNLIFVISSMLIFFACSKPKVLSTPLTVGIVNNEIYNTNTNEYEKTEILIVTDKNKYAGGYKFYITDNNDYENLENYIAFTSDTNYVDITSYFNTRKVYHYFVQYLGKDNYLSSTCSEVKTYTPQAEKVDTPYIQLLNKELSWFRIMNAEGYEIYEEIIDKNNQSTKSLIETTNSETFSLDLSGRFSSFEAPYNTYKYTVKALASGFYQNSNESDSVSYVKEISLSAPSNLAINVQENNYILSWDAVEYATKYEVVINGNTATPATTTENKLDITQYLTNYSTFSFSVKAKESDVLSYEESNYSDILTFDYTLTLSSPENLRVNRNGQFINISWDSVNYAETYTLIVEMGGNEVYKVNTLEDTFTIIEIETYFGELTSDKEIFIKVKANGVSQYIFESDYAEINYTILHEVFTQVNLVVGKSYEYTNTNVSWKEGISEQEKLILLQGFANEEECLNYIKSYMQGYFQDLEISFIDLENATSSLSLNNATYLITDNIITVNFTEGTQIFRLRDENLIYEVIDEFGDPESLVNYFFIEMILTEKV